MKVSGTTFFLGIPIFLGLLLVLASLIIPSTRGPDTSRKAIAKNDVTQIATAMIAFETEYGRPPRSHSGAVDGELLSALMGSNSAINPREIVFLEVSKAENGKSGLSQETFVDPWGGAYQIAICTEENLPIRAGTNSTILMKKVAVWNDPRIGKQKRRWFSSEKPLPYVRSWE